MKKFTYFIIATALASITFMACHKDNEETYTCQCTDNTTKVGTESFQVTAESESEAQGYCTNEQKTGETCFVSP